MGQDTEREAGRRERQQSTGRDFLSIYEANVSSHKSDHSISATGRGSSTSREGEGKAGGEDERNGDTTKRDDGGPEGRGFRPRDDDLGYNRSQRAFVTWRESIVGRRR